ncbi:unnamed protein product [Rhodiola kirilowii]
MEDKHLGGPVEGQEEKIGKSEPNEVRLRPGRAIGVTTQTAGTLKKRIDPKARSTSTSTSTSSNVKGVPALSKLSVGPSLRTSVPAARRTSTGGIPEKKSSTSVVENLSGGSSDTPVRSDPLYKGSVRRSLPESRKTSLTSVASKSATYANSPEARKPALVLPGARNVRLSTGSDNSKQGVAVKSTVQPALSVSASKRATSSSSSLESSGGSKVRTSPLVTSGLKARSSSSSIGKSSAPSNQRRVEAQDSRLIVLPQVEMKVGDDVRLDLRGRKVRSLDTNGLNLSPSLEFVYLRDNLLATLNGIEVLKRVKVLDLSFNDFKGPGFEPLQNCRVLQQLYLAGNQITSLISLPELPNLEFLSVAQNKLKSLSMASQPRLQVLAASRNKIRTLKGFPHLPVLEHLRVEENPILQMPHLEAACILLTGPTLKKFNDRDLSKEEVLLTKRYPAHTALCIRDGWELCRPELAAASTFRFLFEQWKNQLPQGYVLKDASVDKPFEEDPCYSHFDFAQDEATSNDSNLVLEYQWFIGERTSSNFVAIPDANIEAYWPKHEDIGKVLKVECTPMLDNVKYPTIFAISRPVSPGTGHPKVVSIDVHGELVEGNIITGHVNVAWCGGTPYKGVACWLRRKWNSSPVVISGAEDEEYLLTLDDIGSSLVFMYTPVTKEGVKGEPQYKYTDFVKAAPPSVSNLQIVGDLIEECTLKGTGNYFGGREGPSQFKWLRENNESGDFKIVLTGTAEYTLTKDDVGKQIAFVYVPINFEGQEGVSVSVVSQAVKHAPPKVMNLKIIGDLKENSKVTVTGTVIGGTEGSSRVQWFKTMSSAFTDENHLEAVSTSKIAKAFRIPLGAVGYHLVAKFTPMTLDGESGEPAFVISDTAIETLPPSLNFLSVTGDYIEGRTLTASYGYVGGHEGKSIYNWHLHENESDSGCMIPEVSGSLQYQITKDSIGRFISFTCTPVRDDGTAGESSICMGTEKVRPGSPRVMALQVKGTAVECSTLTVDKKYWGGQEGESLFRWFRTSSDGTQTEVRGATAASYILSVDDIGCFISVSCEPQRNDGARGAIVFSEQLGPVMPGPPTCQSLHLNGSVVEGNHLTFSALYIGGEKGNCQCEWFRIQNSGTKERISTEESLRLTLHDVGRRIELVYTPVRQDALKGNPVSVVSDVIAPGSPVGLELKAPDCCENKEAVPYKVYFGGEEGVGEYVWYRTKRKLSGAELLGISHSFEGIEVCARTITYTPTLDDVGEYLALYWLPKRVDGICGNPVISISDSPVVPAPPSVSNVQLRKMSSTTYSGEGVYSGGYEGSSIYSWYRETNEGTIIPIPGANSKFFEVTDSEYNCRLLFGYTPVRSDLIVGELILSEPTDIILPEVPVIEMLAFTGKAVERDVLSVVEVIPKSVVQQLVWNNYKKHVQYQWFSTSDIGDEKSFEPVISQSSRSYRVQFEDIGKCLKCECIVTDVFGRSSVPVYAETAPVAPGIPKVDKLEIEGRGFHTNLYAVRGTYSGGKEGKSRIQWLRSMVGSPDLISIPGETGTMYEANVDDVGYRLVAIYNPVREDGIEGQPVSTSTEPIAVEPDVLKEVRQKLDLGAVKFEVLCDKDRSPKKVLGSGSLERRTLEVNRKRIKVVKPGSKTSFPTTEIRGSYTPPFHVELFRNDQHRLRIVVDSENEVDLMVQTRHLRDVIVLVIRGFAQRFNSTSLNSLLKVEI